MQQTQRGTLLSNRLLKNSHKTEERRRNNLHNPIPVVPGRHPEEREESHAKVVEGGVATKTFTWVLL